MINEILNILPDFREKIENKEISVCLLRNDDSPKAPVNGYNHLVTIEELESPIYTESNLGISLLGPRYVGERFLCCIDIDGDVGYTIHEDKQKGINKQSTQKWFYRIIKKELDERGLKPLIVRTMSGGYHIYLYIYEHPTAIHGFSRFLYPVKDINTMEYFNSELSDLFSDNQKLNDFLGKPLKDNAIEIFSQKRMMVAPGSCIDGKYYVVSPDGAQSFDEISELVETNIYDLVTQALIKNFFTINPEKQVLSKPIKTHQVGQEVHLRKENIEKIADLIGNLYPKAGDQKHYCTLALGGYLKTQNIAVESIQAIGEKIIEMNPGLFDSNEAFIQTLLHDSVQGVNGGEATGLKTLQDNLENIVDKGILAKKMHLWTQSPIHSFYPNGEIGNEYTQVTMNYKYNTISKQTMILKKQDNDFIPIIKNQVSVKHVINDIIRLKDISWTKQTVYHNPVYFTYSTRIGNFSSPIYENIEEMIQGYKSIEGAHISGSKTILELIYNEFEEFDLIINKVGSSIPGIFLDQETKQIHRFIKHNEVIDEVEIKQPSMHDLKEAVALLSKINETYPWIGNKFGIFIRNVLTMPFSYILKTYFHMPHPSLILCGEGGTLKSTAGELAVALWGNYNNDIIENIVGGGELNSEYRFGRIMDCSSYPLIINEPEVLFHRSRMRELVKDAVNGQLLRKPGGNNPKEYYSRRSSIYCMNAIPQQADDPAYLRRFVILDFTKMERGDVPEIIENLSFLNENGVRNSKFQQLSVIGDYITYIISKNMDWLELPLESLQQNIIDSITQETGDPLGWLNNINFEESLYLDRTDQENAILSSILTLLRDPYFKNKNKFLNNADPESILRDLITNSNYYPYIHESVDGNSIIIDTGFKNTLNQHNHNYSKPITLSAIYNHLEDTTYNLPTMKLTPSKVKGLKKTVRGIRMTYEEFTRLITNTVES